MGGAPGGLVVMDEQTAGWGRRGVGSRRPALPPLGLVRPFAADRSPLLRWRSLAVCERLSRRPVRCQVKRRTTSDR
jgi:hypothetical protein